MKKKEVHVRVIQDIIDFVQVHGFGILGLSKSVVIGKSGNQEYLLYIKKNSVSKSIDITRVVMD